MYLTSLESPVNKTACLSKCNPKLQAEYYAALIKNPPERRQKVDAKDGQQMS
ncbi:hypothetical protein CES85_2419 [Ochrobactrum quorumnocens]|uniref:Uncharacterized protein n=1 Tax=Ochrobactrum quorumnocens TaxID=271865 RepID=A0A248UHP2_9HYPH|nr:hypothetical protein CES85_2419 [[Ochrobactrum] quorumnocens]